MCFLYEKIIGFWQDRECLRWILRIQSRADTIKVNMLAIGAVVVVLLLVMKSISIPAILVLSIETAIWINMAVPYFTGSTIFYIAYLIISSIQLGYFLGKGTIFSLCIVFLVLPGLLYIFDKVIQKTTKNAKFL